MDIKGLDDRKKELVGILLTSKRLRRSGSNSRSNSRMDSEERRSRSASRSQSRTTAQPRSSQNHEEGTGASQNLTNPEFLANAIMQAQQNVQVSQQRNTHNNWGIRSSNGVNNVHRNLPRPPHVAVRHPQQFQRGWQAQPIHAHNHTPYNAVRPPLHGTMRGWNQPPPSFNIHKRPPPNPLQQQQRRPPPNHLQQQRNRANNSLGRGRGINQPAWMGM